MRRAHAVQRCAEVRVLLADRDNRIPPVPADHVDVEIGDDVRDRHGGVIGEVLAPPQSLFLAAHVQEDDRALRAGIEPRECVGDFHHRHGA